MKLIHSNFILPILFLLAPGSGSGAEQVSLSGTIQTQFCIQSCGTCCGTHNVTDTSGNINLQIGNSFVDLVKIADDEQVHQISGHFYETTGQCGVGECTLFAVEAIDQTLIPAPAYQPNSGKLSIQAVVIDGNSSDKYAVTLTEPFAVDSAVDYSEMDVIPQGGDCSAPTAMCASGTVCVAYFGIAGAGGPEFKTCEIPCAHAGASCPLGQSCNTIADGPGQVCTVD